LLFFFKILQKFKCVMDLRDSSYHSKLLKVMHTRLSVSTLVEHVEVSRREVLEETREDRKEEIDRFEYSSMWKRNLVHSRWLHPRVRSIEVDR